MYSWKKSNLFLHEIKGLEIYSVCYTYDKQKMAVAFSRNKHESLTRTCPMGICQITMGILIGEKVCRLSGSLCNEEAIFLYLGGGAMFDTYFVSVLT